MEQRVRRAADRMSSRSHVVRPVHETCRKRNCEDPPSVQSYCFAHWRKEKAK